MLQPFENYQYTICTIFTQYLTPKINNIRITIMTTMTFQQQKTRKDLLTNMLAFSATSGNEAYHMIMSDNGENPSESRKGFLFETVFQILAITRCIVGIDYKTVFTGQLQNLKPLTHIKTILDTPVHDKSGGCSDFTYRNSTDSQVVAMSVKNKNVFNPATSDVSDIDNTLRGIYPDGNYKCGLVVRDKSLVTEHRYNNDSNIHKIVHDAVITNGLLIDEQDIISGMQRFCERFVTYRDQSIDKVMETINQDYLNSYRNTLVEKLHQRMTLLNFIKNYKNGNRKHLIAHKPRSGKSISLLLICKWLLENTPHRKILIMTAVPATINDFVADLDKWIDFKDIYYTTQDKVSKNPTAVFESGIMFCSTQFLKTNAAKKKELLKNMGFDAMFIDESHLGGSTEKTRDDILLNDVQTMIDAPIQIFASGTSDKTRRFYNIPTACTNQWEMEDECYMKNLLKHPDQAEEITAIMTKRHGAFFKECLENPALNKDYSKHPIQVLMKHTISQSVIDDIRAYNQKHNTNYGFSASSMFALDAVIDENNEKKYLPSFAIGASTDGEDLLVEYFDGIISNNRMRESIMKKIEATQHAYQSRKSTKDAPRMIIVYLPTHTGNNTIDVLQKTVVAFLEKHKLWTDYNIEYSNSQSDSNNVSESYNDKIVSYMENTRRRGKKGCILLLGCQGTTGITYHDCDVTISLDDGQNLDQQKQRFARALTEADGKIIGINVDMNIQRAYLYMIDKIHRHRAITKTAKTNAEILTYMFLNNMFLFDPQEFKNGNVVVDVIKSYYDTECSNMMKQIDDTVLLENIVCDDELREIITTDLRKQMQYHAMNPLLYGIQPECPKGETISEIVRKPDESSDNDSVNSIVSDTSSENAVTEIAVINQTLELCRGFMIPLLALLSNAYRITCFKEILSNPITKQIIVSLLKEKKIEFNETNLKSYQYFTHIMSSIIDNNAEIANNIREIYSRSPPHKLRELIAKHFIPSKEEKRKNAEVSTPEFLVQDMLEKLPENFYESPKLTLEPCCGKGNFVLGVFDKMFKELETFCPDEVDRCKLIIDHLYYADLTAMNVFITTELLKCHVQSYCGIDAEEFADADEWKFHSHVGNSLTMTQWDDIKFDVVIANPPYNDDTGNKGTGHNIWKKFVVVGIDKWIKPGGYLLYVNPSVWRQLDHPLLKKMMENQLVYLEIHNFDDGQKTFKCSTRYDWYLLRKTPYTQSTIIKDEEGVVQTVDLRKWSFIPNMRFSAIESLCATGSEPTVEIIHSESDYEVRRQWMSKVKTETHVHPVVLSIKKEGEIALSWSNITSKGHYCIPKFIFSNGAGFCSDIKGEYGISQWGSGIVDTPENIPLIERVFRNPKFVEIKKAIQVDSSNYNIKIMRLFKKDFWRKFL